MQAVTDTEILIFSTNIHTKKDLRRLTPVLDNDKRVNDWNVDMDDIDRVLRIATGQMTSEDVILLLTEAGFHCRELPE